jgi:hypothetical protein
MANPFLEGLIGKAETVHTRRGDVSARRGGVPGLLANMAGGTANLPVVGPVLASDAPAMDEVSAIHEQFGHNQGKGALYDLEQRLKGSSTPKGLAGVQWAPSEVYAYSTQPAALSQDEILNVYGPELMKRPELMAYFLKHRNPESDWPGSADAWAARLKQGRIK